MDEAVARALASAARQDDAYLVGGAVRDELLGRPVVDVDVVCPNPAGVARRARAALGGALFALSERHGAWRIVLPAGGTVDFSPLTGGIHADLARRDFTVNAIAVPAAGGAHVDPCGGVADVRAGIVRAVSDGVFRDDPLRLLRAVRIEDELGFRVEPGTEALVRRDAALLAGAAGERVLAELRRLSPAGLRRLDELRLLDVLGGSLELLARVERSPDVDLHLIAVLGDRLASLPVPRALARRARAVSSAEPPQSADPRALHRYRRATEPWAADALLLHGRPELVPAVEQARATEPPQPLLRGDELGVPPGPEVGSLLDRIAEERAAGTIATRAEALELVRRLRA